MTCWWSFTRDADIGLIEYSRMQIDLSRSHRSPGGPCTQKRILKPRIRQDRVLAEAQTASMRDEGLILQFLEDISATAEVISSLRKSGSSRYD